MINIREDLPGTNMYFPRPLAVYAFYVAEATIEHAIKLLRPWGGTEVPYYGLYFYKKLESDDLVWARYGSYLVWRTDPEEPPFVMSSAVFRDNLQVDD